MFSKKNKMPNERTLYEGRPNMIIGCKKVIWGIIILVIIMYIANPVKSTIIGLQTYFISYIKFGIMGYVSLAFVLLMLIDLLYIIWQLLSWYSTKYIITNERIITKKGVINTKTTYMPFKSIQDIDLSQNILEKILNVGTVVAYSAYDNNSTKLAYISNPGEVEDILFKKINQSLYMEDEITRQIPREEISNKGYRRKKPKMPHKYDDNENSYYDEEYYINKYESQYSEFDDNSQEEYSDSQYVEDDRREFYPDSMYDEDYQPQYQNPRYGESTDYEQKHRGKRSYNKYEYEEYPKYNQRKSKKYDYERFDDNLEDNIDYAMNDIDNRYISRNEYEENEPYYNDYDYDSMEDFYQNNKDSIYIEPEKQPKKENVKESREEIIQRHFDKFNR